MKRRPRNWVGARPQSYALQKRPEAAEYLNEGTHANMIGIGDIPERKVVARDDISAVQDSDVVHGEGDIRDSEPRDCVDGPGHGIELASVSISSTFNPLSVRTTKVRSLRRVYLGLAKKPPPLSPVPLGGFIQPPQS
jgi:hypothetical protein